MNESITTPLHTLAERYGILTVHKDGLRQIRHPPASTLLAILNQLGCPIQQEDDADRFLKLKTTQDPGRLLPAVAVVCDGNPAYLDLSGDKPTANQIARIEWSRSISHPELVPAVTNLAYRRRTR